MLANRLNVLLAERQLSIKDVVTDTGISRNTISNISNSPSANIATDTIDRLCNYLEITPANFFEYSPYLLKYNWTTSPYDNSPAVAVQVQNGQTELTHYVFPSVENTDQDIEVTLSADDLYESLIIKLPVRFQKLIQATLFSLLEDFLLKQSDLLTSNTFADKTRINVQFDIMLNEGDGTHARRSKQLDLDTKRFK
ncbi:helix-turn-helix domain-containing protein [Lacticaseibacillus daqingensis]|uniref:helix-turn-helix domain-containing protein n=1 Tax=Lacticaseibacillus daqingensis TaxID=2486014 RepID=UPI000F77C7F6|nr:helix-turn-helix transcriptional regulator [Lacticaseibacillus daqingensis]